MFELHDVSLLAAAKPRERVLLGDVRAVFPPGELTALVGPPGAGKTLLLQLLAGVRTPTFGEVVWSGPEPRPQVAFRTPLPPDSSRAAAMLTPGEAVASALRLRTALPEADVHAQTAALLEQTGLAGVAATPAQALSRAARRRLELAVALAGSPGLLLWDEPGADAGFDRLLRTLAAGLRIAVVRVVPKPERLEDFDAVLALSGGQLVYHGPPACLAHYFQIETPAALFERLAERTPEEWQRSWAKHGAAYAAQRPAAPPVTGAAPQAGSAPGALRQCLELLRRRWKSGLRDRLALGRRLALTLGGPLAVAAFAMGGVPRFVALARRLTGELPARFNADALLASDALQGVQLATGLAYAQAAVLALLTAHLVSREIAGERRFLETEKLRGLRAGAYVAAKALCVLPEAALQAVWMGAYVHGVCRLPGSLGWQMGVLALTNAAFACGGLAVSSLARTPGRARRVGYALAALQLPFAGVLLAPPDGLAWLLRPLAPLYWGAGAYLHSMSGTRFFDVLQMLAPVPAPGLCLALLGLQALLGLGLAFAGCKMSRLRVAPRHFGT